MDAATHENIWLDTPSGNRMTGTPPAFYSPDPSQMTTTPNTPRDTRHSVFGSAADEDVSPTTTCYDSVDTTQLRPFGGFCKLMTSPRDSTTNDMSQRLFQSGAIPLHPKSHAHTPSLSHMCFSRPTALERLSQIGQETPVPRQWGSLDTQTSWGSLLSPDHPLAPFSSFVRGRRQTIATEELNRSYADQMAFQNGDMFYPEAFDSENRVYWGQSADATDKFCLEELRNALSKSNTTMAIPDFDDLENTIIRDLGIDVLRLSSKLHPVRQPNPAPPSFNVPPNNSNNNSNNSNNSSSNNSSNSSTATTRNPGQGFLPMNAVMKQTARAAAAAAASAEEEATPALVSGKAACPTKFSTRYHGMHTEANASADHLPAEKNCALWLTNLPPAVSTHDLLASIRGVGRVWCTYINYPDNVTHHTAAAKVVFFLPEAAQRLLSESFTRGLIIRGYRVKVSHNRIKYVSHPVVGRTSRVLIITGCADFVNEASLTKFFKDRFIFQLDEVIELIKAGGRAVVEYRFGSYRCQAHMGKMSLEKDRPLGLEKVEFGDDPCEVGDILSSYGIAAERIQGKGL